MAEALLEREVTIEEQEHKKQISDNYRRLLDLASPTAEVEEAEAPVAGSYTAAPAPAPAPAYAPKEERPAHYTIDPGMENVERIAEHNRYAMYTDTRAAMYWGAREASEPEASYSAPIEMQPVMAPTAESSYEDALPTPRTMGTINHAPAPSAEYVVNEKVGFFAALSTRTKLVLFALISAFIVSLVIICVNNAVLGSLNRDIAAKENRLGEIVRNTRRVEQQIEDITDPDNVDQWASDHGLVTGN